ncbi:MAG TPA: S8 family serine peptidase, partial [Fibrobacteria bacterium]|nr:S8 family serine peptidase [Fibrobacteria bacterium]
WRISFQGGSRIEFLARGEKVPTAAKGGGYTTLTGTSFATPVISAQCAVLVGRFPDLLPFEAKSLLKLHSERMAAKETVPSGARTPEGTLKPCANCA